MKYFEAAALKDLINNLGDKVDDEYVYTGLNSVFQKLDKALLW